MSLAPLPLRVALPLLAPLFVPERVLAEDRQVVEVQASALNVRETPMGRILGTASGGTRLVASTRQGQWLRVDWAGGQGWIAGGYVRRVAGAAVEVAADSLNVREGPSTGRDRIGLVRRGQAYAELARSGDWAQVQLDTRRGWVHRAYVRELSLGANAPAPTPAPAPAPGSGWAALHRGLTLDGVSVPRRGLRNDTLRGALGVALEPLGEVASRDGLPFVSGRVSWFGGPSDTGVSSTETGAVTGERLRSLNSPMNPQPSDLSSRPRDFYYVAMRFDYGPQGRAWWARQKLLVIAPGTGRAVVVRPVDWGPHTRTGRVLDLSPQALRDLGLTTDQMALVAFADPNAPLGPVR